MAWTRRPPVRRLAEQIPGDAGQPIGLAVSASEEEDERLLGKIFHRMLVLRQGDRVGLARVVQQRIGRQPQPARRRKNAGAPVAKAVPVGRHRDRTAPRSSGRERRCRRRACDGCSTSAPSASVADSRRSPRNQHGSAWLPGSCSTRCVTSYSFNAAKAAVGRAAVPRASDG